jgi:hypothetical protein
VPLKYSDLRAEHIREGFMDIALSDQGTQSKYARKYEEQAEKYFMALLKMNSTLVLQTLPKDVYR